MRHVEFSAREFLVRVTGCFGVLGDLQLPLGIWSLLVPASCRIAAVSYDDRDDRITKNIRSASGHSLWLVWKTTGFQMSWIQSITEQHRLRVVRLSQKKNCFLRSLFFCPHTLYQEILQLNYLVCEGLGITFCLVSHPALSARWHHCKQLSYNSLIVP